MKTTHLKPADYERQPWRNGGGTTTELAIQRAPGDDRWLWRVSIAEVARSGPFSDFGGHDRTIVLLDGDGMELAFEGHGTHRIDHPHQPFAFDGAWKADCRLLGGPVRDLNLIVDRERAHGSVAIHAAYGGEAFSIPADWALFLCLRGAVEVEVAGAKHVLHQGELLRIDEAHGTFCRLTEREPGSLVADIRIERQ